MKLKKIASLMLAGIMAVSMLAGCKTGTPDPDDNGGASSNTTSSFTQSVLSKTNAKTQAMLGASDNAKLDNAIAATAAVDTGDAHRDQVMSILWASNDNWGSVKKAMSLMNGAENGFRNSTEFADFNVNEKATMWKDAPITYWTLGIVSSTVDDNTTDSLLYILKRDSQTKEVVPGAHFEVKGIHHGYHNDVITGEDGTATLTGLPVDSYTVTEISVPEPYVVAAEPTQTIWLGPGDDQTLVFDNLKKPQLKIAKDLCDYRAGRHCHAACGAGHLPGH